jgi:L-aminopeptidase/D-esterase-like protein
VDVRGPAPGSRESALLQPDKPIQYIHGLVLTGGSAFGLATADGVMRYLSEHNIGHPTPVRPIPLVPAAVVYDLFMGGQRLPDAAMGYAACVAADTAVSDTAVSDTAVLQGNVGAGAGVTVGKWGGFAAMMKGGFGLATMQVDEMIIGAAAVVNAVGDVLNADGTVLAGARADDGGWLVAHNPLRRYPERPPVQMGTNTTLVVVWTNATLSKVEAHRLAQRAHDGLAIAIRPVHTTHDGDTTFALATGQVAGNFDLVASAAVEMVAEAIRNGVRMAGTVGTAVGLAG